MHKFMILTDSNGNPRGFPASEVFYPEETYPYLLRNYFKDSFFWQLSFGDITTVKLANQPLAYLSHWNPDFIIVHSGINDCDLEVFSPNKFRIMVKKFKLVFAQSKVFWVGVSAGVKREETSSGIDRRIEECNGILKEAYSENFIPIQQQMREIDGFNAFDHIHLNKKAHQVLAEILIERINMSLSGSLKEVC